jgi:hypothetical protein
MDRRSMLLGAAAAALVGCGSGTAGATTGPTTGATAAPTFATTLAPTTVEPQSTAPASFQVAISGDANVTGTWGASYGIDCNNPSLDGTDLIFFAQSPDAKAVVLITLKPGSIEVSERAGGGATYTDREFTGTGVSTVDPARGGTFDSDLRVVAVPNSNPGTLGTITHIAGSVDCGNQVPGTSTAVTSGSSAEGSITGPFTSVRVSCSDSAQYGKSVNVTGVIGGAVPPLFMILNLTDNYGASIFGTTRNPQVQRTYVIDPAGTFQVTPTGGHVDGDFVEMLAAYATTTPHRIHVVGDLACGTFNKS